MLSHDNMLWDVLVLQSKSKIQQVIHLLYQSNLQITLVNSFLYRATLL